MPKLDASSRARSARGLVALGGSLALALGCAGAAPRAAATPTPDPVHSDGDKYRVLLENEQVRVLAYADLPRDKTHLHHHPCFVMYALGPFSRRLSFPDGTQRVRTFRAGDALWMPAQAHVGENVGTTPTSALLVELKAGCPPS